MALAMSSNILSSPSKTLVFRSWAAKASMYCSSRGAPAAGRGDGSPAGDAEDEPPPPTDVETLVFIPIFDMNAVKWSVEDMLWLPRWGTRV